MSNWFAKRDSLEKADAIVVLTGNGWERTKFAVTLYQQGWAPLLLMVGVTGSRPAPEMAEFAQKHGVPESHVIVDAASKNTRQNAKQVARLAAAKGWKKIILVTSPHHQLRAHLTFQKAMRDSKNNLSIINYPPTAWSWFDFIESSRNKTLKIPRFFYIFSELYRILKYRLKGDL